MNKGDKLEKKIEEHIEKVKSNLGKIKELEQVLENLESKKEEA